MINPISSAQHGYVNQTNTQAAPQPQPQQATLPQDKVTLSSSRGADSDGDSK